MRTVVGLYGQPGLFFEYWSPPDPPVVFEAHFKSFHDAVVMQAYALRWTAVIPGRFSPVDD